MIVPTSTEMIVLNVFVTTAIILSFSKASFTSGGKVICIVPPTMAEITPEINESANTVLSVLDSLSLNYEPLVQ